MVFPAAPPAPPWSLSKTPSTTGRSSGRKRASRFCTTTLSALPMMLCSHTEWKSSLCVRTANPIQRKAKQYYIWTNLKINRYQWKEEQRLLFSPLGERRQAVTGLKVKEAKPGDEFMGSVKEAEMKRIRWQIFKTSCEPSKLIKFRNEEEYILHQRQKCS